MHNYSFLNIYDYFSIHFFFNERVVFIYISDGYRTHMIYLLGLSLNPQSKLDTWLSRQQERGFLEICPTSMNTEIFSPVVSGHQRPTTDIWIKCFTNISARKYPEKEEPGDKREGSNHRRDSWGQHPKSRLGREWYRGWNK